MPARALTTSRDRPNDINIAHANVANAMNNGRHKDAERHTDTAQIARARHTRRERRWASPHDAAAVAMRIGIRHEGAGGHGFADLSHVSSPRHASDAPPR